MGNVVELNTINFKAVQYFSNPPMMMLFSSLKTANADDYRQLILMKHIREALSKEGLLIDEAIKEIRERYISELPEGEEPIQTEINIRINNFLMDQEVVIPFPKLKLSQIKGIGSLSDLDAFEGIIEIDVE
jgi:hypothetical protein